MWRHKYRPARTGEGAASGQSHGANMVIAKLDRFSRNAARQRRAIDLPEANDLTVGIMALVAQQEPRAIFQRTEETLAVARGSGSAIPMASRRWCGLARAPRRCARATPSAMRGTWCLWWRIGRVSVRAEDCVLPDVAAQLVDQRLPGVVRKHIPASSSRPVCDGHHRHLPPRDASGKGHPPTTIVAPARSGRSSDRLAVHLLYRIANRFPSEHV